MELHQSWTEWAGKFFPPEEGFIFQTEFTWYGSVQLGVITVTGPNPSTLVVFIIGPAAEDAFAESYNACMLKEIGGDRAPEVTRGNPNIQQIDPWLEAEFVSMIPRPEIAARFERMRENMTGSIDLPLDPAPESAGGRTEYGGPSSVDSSDAHPSLPGYLPSSPRDPAVDNGQNDGGNVGASHVADDGDNVTGHGGSTAVE
ncbi:hypothetical protein BO78DRAFT_413677 [Aspergillus sclerotiicarbonarius CBS 121057]|uniref:Uncharacterized protein n=1 Tax=Aspergillus sclerotiicarbonarius (strain CBS 121057 / IBT 28362) TaxID=1448318 RepID=A0A319ELM9_ASPSB|nr:hypothetical protein BO78DRAFT_413677 [Aspergillus sclerotiicarbonarius CBS 121057]